MKSTLCIAALAALLAAGCGGTSPIGSAPSVVAPSHSSGDVAGRLTTLNAVSCDTGYVGPIRLPISVHGTTFNISWLGSDNEVRGYEVQWQLDVNNTFIPAGSTIVQLPEAEIHVTTEGTYRFRVRGLFCGDSVGGWTDWVIKGTDDTEDHSLPTAPIICPSSVDGCGPPPCLIDCGGDDNPPQCNENEHLVGDVCVPNTPPPFEQYALCHVEFHAATGGHHPHAAYYTEQDKTIHSQGEANGHSNHEFDYLGTCDNRYND